ncbi:gamma-glutamyl hydrolase [Salipaludibacillus keqinensis]|uniref:Gamma-glutamyl hydrolase n=1 Tax=Salipaludibacillus keqinensis TaxID=2045207 RepID=A0A323TFH9_9BACI|nr:NlpC/P60 family protein [Salipaludibacillus keqinensis]PYZ92714.1 gamma-glutamyl hydrolase [Salipaludibacillus keqinensis]
MSILKKRKGPFIVIILMTITITTFLLWWNTNGTLDESSSTSQTSSSEEDIEPKSQGILETNLDFTVEEFVEEAVSLEGADYQLGGKDPEDGFNSSGFVQYVYEEATGIRMPRIAGHQYEIGEEVGKSYLQEGDVVFFESDTIMSGIYIGDSQFMTATQSGGIETLHLENDDFWASNYIGAKRLTEDEMESLHPSTYKDHDHPVVRESMNYLGTPYEFGGNSLEAFDCSFFIQEAFREHQDVYLPRVTTDQFNLGEEINEENLQPGDVLYFSDVDVEVSDREEGEVTHAGIYVGNNFMIHASRTEEMTQISYLNDYWNDAFTGAKRFDEMSLNGEYPIVQEAAKHLNVPFESGGSNPEEGFNTSGFVTHVFEQNEGLQLTGTARELWNKGEPVDTSSLLPGDVLFFQGSNSLLPALYIGHDQFMMASASSGVTTRHLEYNLFDSEPYEASYEGARRY